MGKGECSMTGKRARPRKISPTWKINIPPPVPSWYVNREKSSLDPEEPLWTSYEANDQTEELDVVQMVACSRRAIHLVRRACPCCYVHDRISRHCTRSRLPWEPGYSPGLRRVQDQLGGHRPGDGVEPGAGARTGDRPGIRRHGSCG
jgi:hypothetical protein